MLNRLPNVNQINAALHVPALHLHSFVNLMVWIKKNPHHRKGILKMFEHTYTNITDARIHLHKHI